MTTRIRKVRGYGWASATPEQLGTETALPSKFCGITPEMLPGPEGDALRKEQDKWLRDWILAHKDPKDPDEIILFI